MRGAERRHKCFVLKWLEAKYVETATKYVSKETESMPQITFF